MIDRMKALVNAIGTGLAIGSVVSLTCIRIWSGPDPVITEMAVWLGASVFYGLTSLLYCLDQPLWKLLPLHCLLCLGITLTVAGALRYFTSFAALLQGILPAFLIVYALIFVVLWVYGKSTAQEINEKLRSRPETR